MKKFKQNRGISLIVLVITIIVIIILAGAIILSLASNNPILQAKEATFKNTLKDYDSELSLWFANEYTATSGSLDLSTVNATKDTGTYTKDGDILKIKDIIPSIQLKDEDLLEIKDGVLVYIGTNDDEIKWAEEIQISNISPNVTNFGLETYENGINNTVYSYTGNWNIISNNAFAGNNCYSNNVINDQESSPTTFNVNVPDDGYSYLFSYNYKTSSEEGYDFLNLYINGVFMMSDSGVKPSYIYFEKILSTGNNQVTIEYTKDLSVSAGDDCVYIDNINVEKYGIASPRMVASPTEYTNENVIVTITYSNLVTTKEYSLDGTTWNLYTSPVEVNTNNTTVYSRGIDSNANESAVASLTVSNIDKVAPTVQFGMNGGSDYTASTTVTVSDDKSGINTSTLQYVWDTQNVTAPNNGWSTFTNGETLIKSTNGTYYLWIKAVDNAGNEVIDKTNIFTIVAEISTPVGTVQTVNKTFSGATTGFSYNNPVIPAGFVAVNTNDASWNNLSTDWDKGLVIKDLSGNQFVWVPVDGTNVTYSKWCTTVIPYDAPEISDDTTPTGFNATNITTTYKGFYVARYEAMFDYNGGSIRAASKKSQNIENTNWNSTKNTEHSGFLWNFVSYTESKQYAENMAVSYGYDTSKVGTNLITGTEWDTTMKWIQNSGKDVADSKDWGNFIDSISPANVSGYGNLQLSGYSNYWKSKNIYDIAGNVCEYVNENCLTMAIYRGGSYVDSSSWGAAMRYNTEKYDYYRNISFRIALYVL